jgi:acyl-CoA thioesterase-2
VVRVDAGSGVAAFLSMLDLERLDDGSGAGGADGAAEARFAPRGYPETGTISFVFGGQLLAQSVVASAATVEPDRRVHSVHAHFLKPGSPERPYTLRVGTVREGRSFSHRRVEVGHGDEPFFAATVSLTRPRSEGAGGRELGEYQQPLPPGAGDPDHDGPWKGQTPFAKAWGAFEILEFDVPEPDGQGLRPFSRRLWLRLRDGYPGADPVMSPAALAFASDLGLIVAASVTEGTADRVELSTSLDHALWFHRPTDVLGWHLIDMVSISNAGGRSVVRASFHRQDGTLVATAAQEAFIR